MNHLLVEYTFFFIQSSKTKAFQGKVFDILKVMSFRNSLMTLEGCAAQNAQASSVEVSELGAAGRG